MHFEGLSHSEIEALTHTSKQGYFQGRGYDWKTVEPILILDKIYRKVFDSSDDIHHIIGRSRGGNDVKQNRQTKPRRYHKAQHIYFDRGGPVKIPHEQTVFNIEDNQQVIQEPTLEEIVSLVQEKVQKGLFYRKGVMYGK